MRTVKHAYRQAYIQSFGPGRLRDRERIRKPGGRKRVAVYLVARTSISRNIGGYSDAISTGSAATLDN